ncbi:Carboxylesterase protein [Dioscorea alata]|uniref:Carboxylesterase protein n=1 Tax=Dioscorea alata TaxID=55571 RepID=A0ACB7VXC3_DIOAL|nr:Carboxylesterase protein [Dioscorea alata]
MAEDLDNQIDQDFGPLIRVYKSGRIERMLGTDVVPPSTDPSTGVSSKDLLIDPTTGLSVRLYLPADHLHPDPSLPLLIYFHGGGFCIESASSPTYHNYLNSLVARSNITVVSVDYRRAPEHPLPAAYDDSWAALRWVANLADFKRVFLAGDSAGANIAHRVAMMAGNEDSDLGMKIKGMALIHSYFWGTDALEGESEDPKFREGMERMWRFVCPSTTEGSDDVWANPMREPAERLARLGCQKVMVWVAEKDFVRARGVAYCEALKKSGWNGDVKLVEHQGQGHVFHLLDPQCQQALEFLEDLGEFLNQE